MAFPFSSPSSWQRVMRLEMVLGAVLLGLPALGAVSLDVTVRARAVEPGEPVRVVVTSAVPLQSASATFLDREVFLVRESAQRWSGWSLVALDQPPGLAVIDARGLDEDGGQALGTLAVTIRAREFPTEELTVSSRYVEPPPEVQARLERERKRLAAIYETRSPRDPLTEPFARPVPGEATSIFGTRRLFNGEPRSPHPGLDLRAAEGTEVVAPGPGRVVLAQDLYYSGNTVILDHGGGLYTLYAHLASIEVEEGREIARGEALGLSGATGRVTGPHLHWGAKIGDTPFNPTALLDPGLF